VIDALVFSRDRACQLDLLLRSIGRFANSLYESVSVLYRGSSRDFMRGYALCFSEHAGVRFQLEGDFQRDVHEWLGRAGPTVSFLCDDDVFYREAVQPPRLPWSYRGGDFDYLFSLDGNVYSRLDVQVLLHGLRFRNPTELEHQGHLSAARLPFVEVGHGQNPALVGLPLNRVSDSSGMGHLGVHEYDLNERYLAGERMLIPKPSNVEPPDGPRTHVNLMPAMR
jgi:hypothetical protein